MQMTTVMNCWLLSVSPAFAQPGEALVLKWMDRLSRLDLQGSAKNKYNVILWASTEVTHTVIPDAGRAKHFQTVRVTKGGCLLIASVIFVHRRHDCLWRRRRENSCSFLSFNCDTKSDRLCLFSSLQFSLVNLKMEVEMMDNHK